MSMGRNVHALVVPVRGSTMQTQLPCQPERQTKKPESILLPFTVGFKGLQIQHMQYIVGGWAKMYFHLCCWLVFY